LLAPKGTPAALRRKINQDLVAAISSPEVRARYKTFNFDATPWSPEQTQRTIEARSASYEQVIRKNHIALD
jgi:tripartite-type tricarboxylate transporter receptor subunit TctC